MNDRAHVSAIREPRPLIVHVVYRFDVGGLENGVVNLINRLPVESYRHAVVALTEITDFRHRVVRDDVYIRSLSDGVEIFEHELARTLELVKKMGG